MPYVAVRDGSDRAAVVQDGTVTVGRAKSIAFVLGTRPEVIKVAPVS